jgi:uncharacterized membrane protein YesL
VLFPLRALRQAAAEFFFDLPRMALLNLFWVLTAVPAIFLAFGVAQLATTLTSWQQLALNVWIVPVAVLVLGLAGPGTAAIYYVTNRLANGELLEISRFFEGFRKYFWRGWGLALLNVFAAALLTVNVVFYWSREGVAIKIVALVFGYLLVLWFAIQGYLFSLLVQLDQSIRLVVRNALFLAIDNLGVTLSLTLVNALIALVSVPPWSAALALPLLTMTLTSNVHNKVIVELVERYRAEGRMFASREPEAGTNSELETEQLGDAE